MTKLQELYTDHGQSPWLDNLTRGHVRGGELRRLIADGIRGVTSNPTIFAKAITGSFEGLGGPATVARLHEGIAKGARGKAVADLTITKATNGTIAGSVTLTAEQVEALKQGRLYIQVHGDKGLAPDGANLWGWLLR